MSIWKKKDPNIIEPDDGGKKLFGTAKTVGIVVVVLFIAVNIIFGAFYRVSEQEQAVVTQFGQVIRVDGAGLYFKVPFLQAVHLVDTTTHGMPIGYANTEGGNNDGDVATDSATTTIESEAVMITSDFNFVNVDFYLEYRVSDPVKYLYASWNPEAILKNTAQECIRSTVVKYSVDDVITTGKSQIQSDVREGLTKALMENDIGIQVVNISMQDAEPPTAEVMQAFKSVETAKQGADTAVNNAKKYQSEQIPAAEAEADKILQAAEASKESRINEAEGDAAAFEKTFAEYQKYPLITKQRMFYETMEDVLPDLKIIIDDGGTQKMLPLDNFYAGATAAAVNADTNANEESAQDEAAEEAN
ncbi:membrane protease subunit HflK [Lachnospiraceae bacterium]|nr:membrane protease subunit HflK [Lachnospiraceae bacterium]